MSAYDVRKTALTVETVWHERGPRLAAPLLVGTSIAVIRNPFAGHYEPGLMSFQASLRDLARELAAALIARLGGADKVEAYGKGIVVGEDGHIHAAYVRSHFGTAEMTVWDAPRRDEIAFALVMATGGRPHARIGGLAASDISVHDGQR